ncbi:MAG: ATP-binding protein [Bacteroidota bacterium]
MNYLHIRIGQLLQIPNLNQTWQGGDRWSSLNGWLYMVSYFMICVACFIIPVVIGRYLFRKQVNPYYRRIYILFGAFIFTTGTTFFLDAFSVWIPIYTIKAIASLITGIVSVITLFYLFKFLPRAFTLRVSKKRENYKNEERFRLLVEEVKDYAIMMVDLDGSVGTWNKGAEAINGYTADEIIGEPISIFYTKEDIAKGEPENNLKIARELGRFGSETKRVRKDGSVFWANCVITALHDDHGVIYGYSTVTRDVTERKKLQDGINQLNQDLEKRIEEKTKELHDLNSQLEYRVEQRTQELNEANKALESFSYSVSHDLRAPLRIMDGYSDILLEDHSHQLDNEGKRILDIIMNNARRMGKLIDALLNLSRLGRKELSVKPINMNDLLKKVINDQPFPGNRSVDVRIADLFPAIGDAELLEHVWGNLISNALKYSSKVESPEIEINSMENGQEVTYSVKDNGVGFDMKYSDKLFGVFQRLHKMDEYEGTGIGLALVQRIVTKNSGRVWAESEPGKGATFYFTLPARLADSGKVKAGYSNGGFGKHEVFS